MPCVATETAAPGYQRAAYPFDQSASATSLPAGVGSSPTTRTQAGHTAAPTPTPLADLNTLAAQNFAATCTGAMVGTVVSNSAQYLAGGGFQATYNFAAQPPRSMAASTARWRRRPGAISPSRSARTA